MTDWPPVQANVFLKILYLLSLQSRGEVGRQTRHPGQAHTILKIVDVGLITLISGGRQGILGRAVRRIKCLGYEVIVEAA